MFFKGTRRQTKVSRKGVGKTATHCSYIEDIQNWDGRILHCHNHGVAYRWLTMAEMVVGSEYFTGLNVLLAMKLISRFVISRVYQNLMIFRHNVFEITFLLLNICLPLIKVNWCFQGKQGNCDIFKWVSKAIIQDNQQLCVWLNKGLRVIYYPVINCNLILY